MTDQAKWTAGFFTVLIVLLDLAGNPPISITVLAMTGLILGLMGGRGTSIAQTAANRAIAPVVGLVAGAVGGTLLSVAWSFTVLETGPSSVRVIFHIGTDVFAIGVLTAAAVRVVGELDR